MEHALAKLGQYTTDCYVCGVAILRRQDEFRSKLLVSCKSRQEAETLFKKWKEQGLDEIEN